MARPGGFRVVWVSHVLVGVPLAAFLHSVLQFAYESSGTPTRDLWLFPVHFALGMVVGSVILVPAFSCQAALFFLLARCGIQEPLVVALCSAFQGGLVMLWARTVGIEPSLAGRFELTPPMIVAGFIAGAVAALSAAAIARRRSGQDGA